MLSFVMASRWWLALDQHTHTNAHSPMFEFPQASYKIQGVRDRHGKRGRRGGKERRKEAWKWTDGEGELVIVLLCFPSWQLASLLTNPN